MAIAKEISTSSLWIQTQPLGRTQKLNKNLDADVAVVGGGITGLTAAYLLLKAGRKVIVLDRGPLAEGDTGFTTAHLTLMADPGYADIRKTHGEEAARSVFQTHTSAIDFIEELCGKEKIHCDFSRLAGYLFLGEEQDEKILREEFAALKAAGFDDARWEEKVPLPSKIERPAVCLPRQARFHPLRYLEGLKRILIARGGEIYTDTLITKSESQKLFTDNGFKVSADHIVIATHSPFTGSGIFFKQAPYRTYAVGVRIPKGSVKDALFWDTEEPYHYIRLQPLNENEDVLIVGGQDHKTGQASFEDYAGVFEELERWTRRYFQVTQPVEYRWSGQVLEPVDGLPFIGKIPYRKNEYFATGFSGNGMTYGTAAAMLLTDLVLGRRNRWKDLYNPTRKNVSSIGEFLKENLNNAKEMIGKRLGKGCISSLEELAPNEGAILCKGMKRIAVYREEGQKVRMFSAVCPHMGCIVQWNPVEKTFDCPCHGSRFTAKGGMVHGPANKNLDPWSM